MRRFLTVVFLICIAPLAGARAEDGAAPTYPLDTWNETWKVGDVVTAREENQFSAAFQIEAVNQAGETETQDQELSKTETLLYQQKCLAVDDKGRRSKFVVHFTEWVLAEGEEKDTTLQGKHVEVTVTDGKLSWKLLTPGMDLAEKPKVTEWLEENYGKDKKSGGRDEFDRFGRPKAPVKVGDTWQGDPLAMDFPFSLKKDDSRVDLKLVAVDGGVFRIQVKVHLQVAEFPLGDTGMAVPFTDGGVLEGEGEISGTLTAGAHGGGGAFKGKLQGTASQKGLITIKLGMEVVAQSTVTAGGEMPSVPQAKPAEPAGVPK